MKLEGSLDAFSLPDVFQLLSLTKKSGGLHLANGQSSGVVYFAGGAVTGACSDASRQALARRLVGLGACDDAVLRRAVERATAEDVGVARALAEAGAVPPERLQQLALEQTVDAVFDLLRWPEGDFSFGVDEANPDDVGLVVPAEQVVAEATRRSDTWDAVSRIIPSPDVVLTMPVVVTETPGVSADEWALLALIDGHRSVGELVDVSGAGQFAVVSTLAALVQRGLLLLTDEDAPNHVTLVRRRQNLLAPLESVAPPPEPAVAPAPAVALEAQLGARPDLPPAAPIAQPTPAAPAEHAPAITAPADLPAAAPVAPAAAAAAVTEDSGVLGGAHQPANVVPPRPEPFTAKRTVEHPEPAGGGFSPATSAPAVATSVAAGGASAAVQPVGDSAIERDPTVNRSLMLRLIAGVRGL
ncbi:MAG TPA: DUF4388 domain-containing protein [Actinomycetes bacterium]|nr:DUF4388 domain-containing protein [Actinomycetes bacterium]